MAVYVCEEVSVKSAFWQLQYTWHQFHNVFFNMCATKLKPARLVEMIQREEGNVYRLKIYQLFFARMRKQPIFDINVRFELPNDWDTDVVGFHGCVTFCHLVSKDRLAHKYSPINIFFVFFSPKMWKFGKKSFFLYYKICEPIQIDLSQGSKIELS